MRLFKYHLIFIASYLLLMEVVNYSSSGNMYFNILLFLLLIVVTFSICCLSAIANAFFKSYNLRVTLATIYVIAYLISTLFIAANDPNRVDFITKWTSLFTDIQFFLLTTIPYVGSIMIVLLFSFYNDKKQNAPSVNI